MTTCGSGVGYTRQHVRSGEHVTSPDTGGRVSSSGCDRLHGCGTSHARAIHETHMKVRGLWRWKRTCPCSLLSLTWRVRTLLQHFFARQQVTAQAVPSVTTAMASLAQRPVQVVLTDLFLPVTRAVPSGAACAERHAADPGDCHGRLYCSGHPTADDRGRRLGVSSEAVLSRTSGGCSAARPGRRIKGNDMAALMVSLAWRLNAPWSGERHKQR